MELRTALLTIAILAAGFGLGRFTAPKEPGHSGGDGAEPIAASAENPVAVRLEGRPTTCQPAEGALTAGLAERLGTIEQLLLAMHLPSDDDAHDAKLVERISEVWIPIIRESLDRDRFDRAKAGVTTYMANRIDEDRRSLENARASGHSTLGLHEPLRQLEQRLARVEAARTPDDLVAVLTRCPDENGALAVVDARALVHGYVYPH